MKTLLIILSFGFFTLTVQAEEGELKRIEQSCKAGEPVECVFADQQGCIKKTVQAEEGELKRIEQSCKAGGLVECVFEDQQDCIERHPEGGYRIMHSDGSITLKFPNGIVETIYPGEIEIIRFPNGMMMIQ